MSPETDRDSFRTSLTSLFAPHASGLLATVFVAVIALAPLAVLAEEPRAGADVPQDWWSQAQQKIARESTR